MDTARRKAARLIVIDSSDRVLLFGHVGNDGAMFWAPPGGGLEPGESFEEAAAREATEELGVEHAQLTRLWTGRASFLFGGRMIDQEEQFFRLEYAGGDLFRGTEATHLSEGILKARWWTIDEIQRTTERVFPEDLGAQLCRRQPFPCRHA
jgi:8-oxo-dGTP diphosphatase